MYMRLYHSIGGSIWVFRTCLLHQPDSNITQSVESLLASQFQLHSYSALCLTHCFPWRVWTSRIDFNWNDEFSKVSSLIWNQANFIVTFLSACTWGFSFLRGGGWGTPFQIHSKGFYKHPNDSRNHPQWLFLLCETCLRHIRNHPTTENYFLRLHFRKLPPENE